MKKIATLAILLILFVGFAGAVTIPVPTYNNGPQSGFKNPGTIEGSDILVDDDFQVGDDAAVLGDLAVTGALTIPAGTTSAGAANMAQLWSRVNKSGDTMSGALAMGSQKITGLAAGTTTNDAARINDVWFRLNKSGDTMSGDLITASGIDINMSGAAILRGVTGTFTGAVSGTSITGSGTVQGEQITSTDDALIYDTLRTNVLTVNTTSALNGDVTTGSGIDINMSGAAVLRGVTGSFTGAVSGTAITGTSLVVSGATYLNGTTLGSGDTLAVTDADKLTVAGVIVPQAIMIPVALSAATVNGTVFIPISGNYQVLGISEVHSVASTAAMTNVTATIVKLTGTQAPATAGVVVMSNTFALKGTPETIQTGTLSTVSGATKVNVTERLGIRFCNPITSLAGGCVSISLKRIA